MGGAGGGQVFPDTRQSEFSLVKSENSGSGEEESAREEKNTWQVGDLILIFTRQG
jgi:hypothetical protein